MLPHAWLPEININPEIIFVCRRKICILFQSRSPDCSFIKLCLFYNTLTSLGKNSMETHILSRLYATLRARKSAGGDKSYVASLYEKGTDKIAEKIREEAEEFITDAKGLDMFPADGLYQQNIRSEAADLLFHMMVMLAHHDVPPEDVFEVLERRFGVSGHDEKASRKS
jgi:phosphoribosyl-ATP pyrophosphohydrolase